MKRQILVVFLLGLSFGIVGVSAGGADISGTWTFSVHVRDGDEHPTFVFEQHGEHVSGTYSGLSGDGKVTGTVRANKIAFSVAARKHNGELITIPFTGRIGSSTTMAGTADWGGGKAVMVDWTATKKAAR